MSQSLNSAVAVIGIDIGKNSRGGGQFNDFEIVQRLTL
jgi:hypothetical protein